MATGVMIILSSTTDRLQVVLGATVITSQLTCTSSWRDITKSSYLPGRTLVTTNNVTDVNVVDPPAANTQRVIDYISVYNADSTNADIIIKYDANGTECILFRGNLASNSQAIYTDKLGFVLFSRVGGIKQTTTTQTFTYSGMTASIMCSVLPYSISNMSLTANTLVGLTGLEFYMNAGSMYWFRFVIGYTANATTTGSRFTLLAPGIVPTNLSYTLRETLTSTSDTTAYVGAYDTPSASNASSLTGGNLAIMEGLIRNNINGPLQARFASEVVGPTASITVKAGSFVHWQKLT
jgi:hypothetical protein